MAVSSRYYLGLGAVILSVAAVSQVYIGGGFKKETVEKTGYFFCLAHSQSEETGKLTIHQTQIFQSTETVENEIGSSGKVWSYTIPQLDTEFNKFLLARGIEVRGGCVYGPTLDASRAALRKQPDGASIIELRGFRSAVSLDADDAKPTSGEAEKSAETIAPTAVDERTTARAARQAQYQARLAEYNRLKAEHEAAVLRAEQQEEANRRQLAQAKGRVDQADSEFDAQFKTYQRQVKERLETIARQQEGILAASNVMRGGVANCKPTVIGVAGAWLDSEGEARANLEQAGTRDCRGDPLANVECSSANFNLPTPGRVRSMKLSYQCTATCSIERCQARPGRAITK